MKNLVMVIVLFVAGQAFSQGALGEVIGTISEKSTGETAYGAVAFIEDNGVKYQGRADMDGRFRISGIPAGSYLLKFRHKGDTMQKAFMVEVPMDGFYQMGDIAFESSTQLIEVITIVHEKDGLRMIDGNLPVLTITSEDIGHSSAKNDIKSLITSASSDVRMTNDGELVFRGARKGDMLYLMDGVKTGSIGSVPSSAIGRMQVYSGGLPAKYGDTLGGVVVMESKSYFDLYRKWEAEEIKAGRMQ